MAMLKIGATEMVMTDVLAFAVLRTITDVLAERPVVVVFVADVTGDVGLLVGPSTPVAVTFDGPMCDLEDPADPIARAFTAHARADGSFEVRIDAPTTSDYEEWPLMPTA